MKGENHMNNNKKPSFDEIMNRAARRKEGGIKC